MKNLFYCLITPPRETYRTPEIDPHERHAHNWREPTAKRLEKEKIVESGIQGRIRGTGRSSFTSSSVLSGSGRAVARKAVIEWLVSRRCCSASAMARFTVAVTSQTQVLNSPLFSFIRSSTGMSNMGLSQARSRSRFEHKASMHCASWENSRSSKGERTMKVKVKSCC
jgi:hypothetical protein